MLMDFYIILNRFIEDYNFNLLNFIFLSFTIVIVSFGSLVNLVEPRLPNFLRQSYRYGKHSHKGPTNYLVNCTEMPKSWFKHFYAFALPWSVLALLLMVHGSVTKAEAPEFVLRFLDFMAGGRANRTMQVDFTCALVATVLMTMQCGRRFYETHFIQIFAKNSKINLSHYLVGYMHYFCAILALLSNSQGFVRGTKPSALSLSYITLLQSICILIFLNSCLQQYKSNIILINLRKDAKTGAVKTEQHLLPSGGFFDLISSPHMFFEIKMYIALLALLPSTTWFFVTVWVFCNQLMNALLTHKWYKENFKNYPKNRRALIPFIL
ncbi:polyprenol reductase [Eurosta solidaginis]|uniref:polyprenol reductase n=1 Tax=Eurosta solidaginis TaxID=178769 RepID=UPI003531180D